MAPHPAVLLAAAAWVLAWVLAAFVFATAPERAPNRRLALVLMLHGIAIGVWFLVGLRPDPQWGRAWTVVNVVALLAVAFLNVWFLSTLPSGFARFWGHGAGGGLLWTAMAASLALPYLYHDTFLPPQVEPWFGGGWAMVFSRPLVLLLDAVASLYLLAFVVTMSAWLSAPRGTPSRDRAFWFMLAFGIHDLFFYYRSLATAFFSDLQIALPPGFVGTTVLYGRPISIIALVSLLGYGILRHQVLDIDLKLKFAVKGSTVAAAFALVFVVASETVEAALGLDGTAFGVAGAAAMSLAFHPIQLFAGRVANRVFPGVGDTPEYRARRRREVFRAGVEESASDQVITERERKLLAAMQKRLGISDEEASEILEAAQAKA